MPDIAAFHPPIVHFAIALLSAGVLLRWLSLSGRAKWSGPAAATLLLAGTVAAVAAVKSGSDAHGPVERVPGSASAVREHEDWGERTRNVFLAVAALELAALALAGRGQARWALIASALVGLGGLFAVYETGEHGGELVYSYAGGVGIRTGDPQDVGHLLLAGLYHQAQVDRRAQRPEDAAALFELAGRRFPSDPNVQLTLAESLLIDRKDTAGAIEALERLDVPDDRRLRSRHWSLLADAYEAAGRSGEALASLEKALEQNPQNQRLKDRVEKLRAAR